MQINCKPLILKTIKRQYVHSSIEDSEVMPVFEDNNAGLKKLSQVLPEQTSDSSAFLNATCPLKYVPTVNSIFHISMALLDIRINCNRIGEGLM
jgi:hypothetical protein